MVWPELSAAAWFTVAVILCLIIAPSVLFWKNVRRALLPQAFVNEGTRWKTAFVEEWEDWKPTWKNRRFWIVLAVVMFPYSVSRIIYYATLH